MKLGISTERRTPVDEIYKNLRFRAPREQMHGGVECENCGTFNDDASANARCQICASRLNVHVSRYLT